MSILWSACRRQGNQCRRVAAERLHGERIRVRSIAFADQRSLPLEESAEEALRRGHRDGCVATASRSWLSNCGRPCRRAKLLTLPSREPGAIRRWDGDPTPLQLSLASGHRWLATWESGEVQSPREIARREGVDSIREPDGQPDQPGTPIVVAVFDETLPPDLTQFDLRLTGRHCGRNNGTELRA
jgi:hypothetical protein